MPRTIELCRYQLPTGRTCGQIPIKGESLCRHHRRLYRRSEAETAQEQAMERLAAQLASLSLPDLLYALYGKLSRIRTTLRTHSEAQLALAITFHRLQEIDQDARSADRPDPAPQPPQPQQIFLKSQQNQ